MVVLSITSLSATGWDSAISLFKCLVIFEIDASVADATGGEPIFLPDGMPVGQVTSGGYGYGVDKSLALGYVRADLAKGGRKFNVSVLGQDHTGTILGEPPFDPTGTRLRN